MWKGLTFGCQISLLNRLLPASIRCAPMPGILDDAEPMMVAGDTAAGSAPCGMRHLSSRPALSMVLANGVTNV